MPFRDTFVEVEGVMEVRTLEENPRGGKELLVDREHEPLVDMLHFQQAFMPDRLPDNFCQDRYTNQQKIFFCLVCAVDLKSPPMLDSHVKGQKHPKNVLQLKRRHLGITEEEDRVGKPEKKEWKPATKHETPSSSTVSCCRTTWRRTSTGTLLIGHAWVSYSSNGIFDGG